MCCYVITNFPDDEIFHKQCRALEKRIPDLQVEKLLEDMDGTLIQIYHHPKGKIEVWSEALDGVDIRSDFNILPYFGKNAWTGETYRFQVHDMVRIKETGAIEKIKDVFFRMNGEVRYDVEGHRKVIRKDECEILYSAEELEKID